MSITREYDRRVHLTADSYRRGRVEIVRYDRAGKWWAEYGDGTRQRLYLAGAVVFAKLPGSVWHRGLPGGRAFDAKVIQFRSS